MYLIITRGDAADPLPIGVCDDPEIVQLAVRSAWRRMQELAKECALADPVGAEVARDAAQRLARLGEMAP